MKKLGIILLTFIFLLPSSVQAITTSATSSILMDMDSKRIIYENNIHEVRSVASISKIMTVTLAIESGKLDNILSRLSDEYDEDAMQAVNRLLALMEPLLIIVLGIVVMIIVVSVLLPIYSMYSSY